MSGVKFPLDMIFIGQDGVVVGIQRYAVPGSAGPYEVAAKSRWVLEVNGGWALRHGVTTGQRASFR
jgi:uncharacterized membrane protein (UPF0127 family)